MNYKLLIQYDGTDFHGWQIQENDRTIQGELQRVVSMLVDRPVSVLGSGRTDAGVHAEGQVAHVHLPDGKFTPEKLRSAINGNLWRDIRIMQCETAPDDFHARFSAKGKTYIYRVVNAPVMSPFWRRFAHLEKNPLDVARMTNAARLFLGKHDWTAFSAANSDSDDRVRTINDLSVTSRWSDQAAGTMIEFRVSGDGFLRYMVRSIVGTLLEVGTGSRDIDSVQTAIVSRERSLSGRTAPAEGLTLLKVEY